MEVENDSLLNTEVLLKGARVLRALNNKTRQRILGEILVNGNTNVTSIYKKLRLKQAVVSLHLKILRDAGFVCTQRASKEVYYSIDQDRFSAVGKLMATLLTKPKKLRPVANRSVY